MSCTEAFSVCHQCELQSRRGTFCLFCEEHTGQDISKERHVFEKDFCDVSNVCEKQLDLEPYTTHTEKKSNVKVHQAQELDVVPGQTPLLPSHHAFAYDSSRMGGHVPRDGGGSSKDLDTSTTSSTLGRRESDVQHDGSGHLGIPDETAQEGQPQKGQSSGVLGRPGSPPEHQHDNCPVDELWGEGDHSAIRTERDRVCGVWQARQPHLCTAGRPAPILPYVGHQGSSGVRRPWMEIGETGEVACPATCQEQGERKDDNPNVPRDGHQEPGQFFLGQRVTTHGREGRIGEDANDPQPKDAGGAGEGKRAGEGEGRIRPYSEPSQEPQREPVDQECDEEAPLPDETALMLAKTWHHQRNPLSREWHSLVHHGRPLLMELACFPDSVLSSEVEKRFGAGSAIRASEWNGADLETEEGVKHAISLIRRFRPAHLWISCECGPFCPLQRLNQRSDEQCERLQGKRNRALQQYLGAMEVARIAKKLKIEVHWEFSTRSEAWKLQEIQDFLHEMDMKKVSCSGCTVGLRTKDGKLSLCKGWTVATKNQDLLSHLDLKCQKNHPRGKCEAGQTAHTARYTIPFARKVIDALSNSETWSKVVENVSKNYQEIAQPAEGADVDMGPAAHISDKEKQEILHQLHKIHRNTGHGSKESLIQALKDRGATPTVLEVAKEWSCDMCDKRKQRDPRRFATLETLPQKWERIQVDGATWMHPITKINYHLFVIIDEGSRFRMARIAAEGSGNTTNWERIKTILEESWFPIFGMPKAIRTDSAGPMTSEAADAYTRERDIELLPIPGEAHWQIGIVEGAIKSIKGMLDTLVFDFPDISMEELLSRCIWVCNQQETYKGYSAMQHALGRAPDEQGRFFQDDTMRPIAPELLDDGGFRANVEVMTAAAKSFISEQAKRRIERALRMGYRSQTAFVPGDLVYYWRKQVPLSQKTTQKHGMFLGPARAIATETRKETSGELRPGSIIWLHRAGRLIKACPEQLRHASPLEAQLESLKGPLDLPWTITSLATCPKRRTFLDISYENQKRMSGAKQWS